MSDKTFRLNINGYEYEMPYWSFPWIQSAVNSLVEGGVPLHLRTANGVSLWIKTDHDVEFIFSDPRDPEIPQNLTHRDQYQIMDMKQGDRRYGYRLLDLCVDDRNPVLIEPESFDLD